MKNKIMDFLECFEAEGRMRLGTDVSSFYAIKDVNNSIKKLRFLNQKLHLLKLRVYVSTVILGYLK